MRSLTVLIGATVVVAMPAIADKPELKRVPPKVFTGVLDCRAIADSAQRLSCFDASVAALAAAAATDDVAIVDRQQVRTARKSLFGFTMPSLRIFGFGGSDKEDSADEAQLDSTLHSARQDQEGRWIFVLADGAVWHQIDDSPVGRPHSGSAVMIRHGALGSFIFHVDGHSGFKVRREG